MSIAIWSSGNRSTSASGNATNAFSTASAHGRPCVSYSNGSSMKPPSYQPGHDAHVRPVRPRRLADERDLRPERLGERAHEHAQEVLADRTRSALGDRPQQLLAAEPGCTITERSGHRLPDGSSSPTRAVSHPTNPAHDPRSGGSGSSPGTGCPYSGQASLRHSQSCSGPPSASLAGWPHVGQSGGSTCRMLRRYTSERPPRLPAFVYFKSEAGRRRLTPKLVGRVSTPEGLRGVRWGRCPTSLVSRCGGRA